VSEKRSQQRVVVTVGWRMQSYEAVGGAGLLDVVDLGEQ
jgi:hypothetical protein